MTSEQTRAALDTTERLRRFLHDLATPLSAIGLHLESASRRVAKGQDPSAAIGVAREELAKVFELFDRGRSEFLSDSRQREDRVP